MKVLRIVMPDGTEWDVPASVIAENKARWYAEDKGSNYQDKYDDTIVSEDKIIDWATNNMNWEDVERIATKVEVPITVDYQDGWVNGEKKVLQVLSTQ